MIVVDHGRIVRGRRAIGIASLRATYNSRWLIQRIGQSYFYEADRRSDERNISSLKRLIAAGLELLSLPASEGPRVEERKNEKQARKQGRANISAAEEPEEEERKRTKEKEEEMMVVEEGRAKTRKFLVFRSRTLARKHARTRSRNKNVSQKPRSALRWNCSYSAASSTFRSRSDPVPLFQAITFVD